MKLLLLNDPALRQVCLPVQLEELEYIKSIVPDMTKLLEQENGAALAANQVGIIKRFFLMRDGTLIINPEIVELWDLDYFEEGCLSIPGASAENERFSRIKIKYKDSSFNDMEAEFTGIQAVAIQHEIDHLNGILYTDHLKPMKTYLVLKRHRKYMKLKGK